MISEEVQKTKDQVPKLVQNLKDRGGFSTFEIMEQIRLTLPAVVKFNLRNELKLIKDELLPFTKKEAYSVPYNIPLHVYELITSLRKAFDDEERCEYATVLRLRFDRSSMMNKEDDAFDLHSTIESAKMLARFYFRRNQYDALDDVLNSVIDCIEKSDDDRPELRSVGIYRDIIRDVSGMGRTKVMERLNKILEKNAPGVYKGMSKSEATFTVPQEYIDAEFDLMYEGMTLDEFLYIFALKYVPTHKQIEEHAEKYHDKGSIFTAFTRIYFTTSGTLSHEVLPGPEHKFEQDDQMYSDYLTYSTVPMHLIILEGQRRNIFNIDNLTNYIAKNPLLSPKRLSVIEKGVYAYLENDYVTAISILIPQIEHILRRFYASLGYSVTSNDMIGTMSDALGTLLNNDDIVIFDKDITRYLKTILSNRTGWNLRNLYCHGIDDSFSLLHADRVFHVLLLVLSISMDMNEWTLD